MEGRKQFTFYRSYYDAVMTLPVKYRKRVLMALVEYAFLEKMPTGLQSVEMACFILMKPTLDTGKSRSAAGRNGGFASAKSRSKKEKEKENEIEKEIEYEYENSVTEGFESFWDQFPVKIGKQAALDAWKQVSPQAREVREGLDRWLSSRQWKQEDGRFIPRAAKFLKEKQFLEFPKQAVPMGATGKLGEAEIDAIRQVMEGEYDGILSDESLQNMQEV